jgi:hypothetical protein
VTVSNLTDVPIFCSEQRAHDSLVVVEDPLVSKLVCAILRRQGYSVMCVEAPEVMKRLCGRDRFADILVTNAPAPFLEFADQIRLLYLSSCPDPRLEAQFSSCRMVRKPFTPADLVHAVAELEAVRRT